MAEHQSAITGLAVGTWSMPQSSDVDDEDDDEKPEEESSD